MARLEMKVLGHLSWIEIFEKRCFQKFAKFRQLNTETHIKHIFYPMINRYYEVPDISNKKYELCTPMRMRDFRVILAAEHQLWGVQLANT